MKKWGLVIWCAFLILEGFSQRTSDDDYGISRSPSTPTKTPWMLRDHLFYGGGFGLSFGTYTAVNLNPQVGVKIFDFWGAGVGIDYNYIGSNALNVQAVGPSVFTRFKFFNTLLLHGEYNQTYLRLRQFGYEGRTNFPMFLAGAGYQQGEDNGGFFLLVLFDLIEDPRSPFISPIIRAGFSIGF